MQWLLLVTSGLGLYAFCRALQIAFAAAFVPNEFHRVLAHSGFENLVDILWPCFIGPILEELIFRKFLFAQLEKYLRSTLAAVAVSVGAFTLAHFRNLDSVYIVNSVFLGVVCHVVYLEKRTLVPPIIIHVIFNLIIAMPKRDLLILAVVPRVQIYVGTACVILMSAFLTVWSIIGFRRLSRSTVG